MNKVKLLDVCNITTGNKDSNQASLNGKFAFFTCAPKPLKINNYSFDGDYILLAGNNAAGNFHCSRFNGKFDAYQRTYVISAKTGWDIDYIYYSLKTNLKNFSQKAQGSQTKFLTMLIINTFLIDKTNYLNQVKIAGVLKSIDKKINNNNQINTQLEELAKTIYDYWFLQFEFPNEQGKPYKSSGGKMVYNEQLKREIPEGWEVVNIRDICSVTWGQCPDGENILSSNYNGNDAILYCSGAGDMRNGLLVDCQAKTNASRRYAHKNDILMSVAGSIGAMAICNNKISLGRAAAAFTPKENRLLYSYLTISKFISRMKDVSSGSIQKVVNDSHLNEMNIPYCKEIVNKFAIFNILINMEIKNEEQNKELSSLRDFLLPLLMNGQVTFKE